MMYKGAVAPKTALPYGRDSCIAWNRCHIFTNKRGAYDIIADDLRFDTQLSNVYGNAIRHARCQKLFLFSLSVAKQKKKEGKIWNGSPVGMGHS